MWSLIDSPSVEPEATTARQDTAGRERVPLLSAVRSVVVRTLCVVYVASIVLPIPGERYVLALVAIVGLAVMFLDSEVLYRWVTGVLLGATLAIAASTSVQLGAVWLDFAELLDIVVLIILLPTLAVPFRLRPYGEHVSGFLANRVKRPTSRYAVLSGASVLLSTMISVGAVPVVHVSIPFFRRKPDLERRALTRGPVLAMMWSPMSALFTTAVATAGARLPRMVIVSFGLVLTIWAFDVGVASRVARRHGVGSPPAEMEGSRRELLIVLGALIGYTSAVYLFHRLVGWSVVDAIVFVAGPYVLLWAWSIREVGRAVRYVRDEVDRESRLVSSQGSVLIAIGLFGAAFTGAGFGDALIDFIVTVGLPPVAVLFVAGLLPLVLGPLGFHPFVVVVLILGVLDPRALGVAPESLAVAVLGGAAGAIAISPFTAVVNLAARLTKGSPIRIGLANARFGIAVWVLSGILALAIADWA